MVAIEDKRDVFIREMLRSHNLKRRIHGATRVRKSASLTIQAQEWADKLINEGKYESSNNPTVGESIAYKFKRDIGAGLPKASDITDDWYDEEQLYDYNREQYCKGAGHFTQMVWKNTKHIGVGISWDVRGKVVIVVNYKPAGNIPGMFKFNVSDIAPLPEEPESDGSQGNTDTDDNEFDDGKLLTSDVVVDFYKNEDGQKVKRTIKTMKFEIVDKNSTIIRTVKKSRLSYLTISDLPQTFAEQLKRCKFDLSEVEGNQTDGQDDRRLGLAQSFRAEMLKSHNKIRSAYGGKELTESGQLEMIAQRWAQTLLAASTDKTGNLQANGTSKVLKLGESIVSRWIPNNDSPPDPNKIVYGWLDCKKFYNFQKGTFSELSGNFTQLVWKGTREIGIGIAWDKTGKSIVVCNYYPPGNINGSFIQNIQFNDFK